MALNPLSREQKLLAEIVVQLGNVTEAIRAAAAGEDSGALNAQITQLQQQIASLTSERAQLNTQIAEANTTIAQLQQQIADDAQHDVTPDSIAEVMSGLNIDYTNG